MGGMGGGVVCWYLVESEATPFSVVSTGLQRSPLPATC